MTGRGDERSRACWATRTCSAHSRWREARVRSPRRRARRRATPASPGSCSTGPTPGSSRTRWSRCSSASLRPSPSRRCCSTRRIKTSSSSRASGSGCDAISASWSPRARSWKIWWTSPDSRSSPSAGAAKALRVDTRAGLLELWPRLAAAGLVVLVQQLIPGPETQVESYHVYVDEDGDPVGEFTGRKLRTWPPAYGHSTALVISDAPDVAALGRDVVARLGLHGVAKLDFKRASDGRLFLLEVNPRFNLWHHVGARAGVNLPALVYADLVGEPRPHTVGARAGVRWCQPWLDVRAARQAGVSWLAWLWWTLGCEAKRTVAWDDPLPLVGALLDRALAGLVRRVPLRRLRRHA